MRVAGHTLALVEMLEAGPVMGPLAFSQQLADASVNFFIRAVHSRYPLFEWISTSKLENKCIVVRQNPSFYELSVLNELVEHN